MFRRILAPVDGSSFSEHAIPHAARIAAASGAKLELALVHSVFPPVGEAIVQSDAVAEWEREQRRRETDYLHDLARRLTSSASSTVDPLLLTGDVVAVLEHEIQARAVDLVVMTTHGRGGLARAWLGSVADALIRHVDPPLLLIRPVEGEGVQPEGSAAPFTHVLIALDGSEQAERALEPATALARMDAARVTLLRVASPPLFPSPYIPFAVGITEAEQQHYVDEARGYIDGQLQKLKQRGIDATGETPFDYSPAHAVLQFAERSAVDLVALGTHGRGLVERSLLGSVSDKVVRAADVPVLVC